jgi:16S rRNA C967 or C1407 C5-methylase (RsmB/RsmF family)
MARRPDDSEKLRTRLLKIANKFLSQSSEVDRFVEAVEAQKAERPCAVWLRNEDAIATQSDESQRIPFLPRFCQAFQKSERSQFRASHDAGDVYLLDASSVFDLAALSLLETKLKHPNVLDLCAAPGGKSILTWRWLQPKLLVANEISQDRLRAMISNFSRCKITNARLCSLNVEKLTARTPEAFDLVLVDAPCSGQSLYAKGEKSPGAFNKLNIERNAMRQRGILASAAHATKGAGFIIYSTCTYSKEENEDVIQWFMKKFTGFKTAEIPSLQEFRVEKDKADSDVFFYRLLPHQGYGAGGFTVLLHKENATGPRDDVDLDTVDLPYPWRSDIPRVERV